MSEAARTLTYVGVALLVLTAAILTRPTPPKPDADSLATETINKVDDPLSATELEIVKYDEADSSSSEFKVAKVNGRWVIPSYENYPADAEQQMGSAAVSVMNLKVLDMISDKAGEHKTFGVVEPKEDLPEGTVGVGMRVTMKNEGGDKLVDMIVGKEVKDQAGQRYVRLLGRDTVYVVKLDSSKLSTKFEDWIEKDLLKLNPADLAQVRLNDYSVDLRPHPDGGLAVKHDVRSEIAVDYKSDKSEWALNTLEVVDPASREKVKIELPEDEQLDQVKLNDMKSALGDLKIVSVEKKPEGLGRDLKASKQFAANQKTLQSLVARGYFPFESKGAIEILSKEGEIVCRMKDGVEYILRFGQPLVSGKDGGGSEEGDGKASKGRNRYLFVMAKLDENAIPKPDLAQLPEVPDDDAASEEKSQEKSEEKSEEKPTTEAPQSDEPKSETPKTEEPKAKKGAEAPAGKAGEAGPAGEKSVEEATGKDAEKKNAETNDAKDAPAQDANAPGDEKTEEGKKEPAAEPAVDAPKPQPKLDKKTLAAAREALEKENKKKQDDYDAKVKAAQTRVSDLNKRFGDWYFIISDDVYKKIHLGRNDISKKKEAPKGEGAGLDTLKDPEQGFPGLPGAPKK